MAWGLNLADLKEFAWNSIKYSSLPENRKTEGFQKWENQWNLFIDYAYTLACNQTFPNVIMNISDILPGYGPYNQSINVTLFGSGFETAICKQIICKFGEKETNGILVDLNEIICPTPTTNKTLFTVSVSIKIDNELIESGLNYQFVSSLLVIDDGTLNATISSKSDQIKNDNQKLIAGILILLSLFIL
jgi:hypothetical protein